MKLSARLLIMALLPVICLGFLTYLGTSSQIRAAIEDQTYEGMQATTLAVREVFDSVAEGEYRLDGSGQMWKGENFNISEATDIIDTIKEDTGFDVSIFYGDERVLTTIVDGSGNRQIGTAASAEVSGAVLEKAQDYKSNNAMIFDKRYICYYIPLYQENSETVVGMIFLGEEYAKVSSAVKESRRQVLMIMMVVFVIVCITSLLSARSIASSIKEAIAYVDQMCKGHLGLKASEKMLGRKDEIGDMCRGVKTLDDNLTAIVREIQTQSRILGETSDICSSSANKAMNSAEQVDAAAEEVAAATTTQAQGAMEAESSVNVIGQTIEVTNDQMQEFAHTSDRMSEASEGARKTLAELNQSMNQVREAVDHIHHQTNETHISVEKIGEMTNVITAIAEQTNLLSLNASIEAARAGEMGKGFAVVAEEIRKLAEQCSTSAVEIQELLGQLKNNSDVSVRAMEEVQEIIQTQADKLSETNQVFGTVEEGIEQSVQGIGKIMDEMSTLNGARSHAVSEVQNVAELAQQNAASIEETAASIDEVAHLISTMSERMGGLQQVADVLKEKISVFELS